jgi:2'-5' RNA ligase
LNKKYFIAILLPEPLLGQVEALKQELLQQFNLKGALRSPSHITLHRPFEWKEEKEEILIKTLEEFQFDGKFSVRLNNFNSFTPRVIYVDVTASEMLEKLHTELKYFAQEKLHLFNEVGDMRGFHPHVTIAFRDLKKNKFPEVWKQFSDRKFTGDFPYTGFSLLKLEKRWEPIHKFA